MNRRNFLWLTLAGIPIAACHHPDTAQLQTLARPDFLLHVCDTATIRAIGQAYRAQVPKEAGEETLIRLLQTSPPKEKTQEDYASGHTTTVKGWVLSLTEARQCALYSIAMP
jgi:hypothetical protein